MLCKKPYMFNGIPCPCGKCLPCRINKRRVWSHRILLESFSHAQSSFVTLTYNDESLPYTKLGLPDLEPKDVQKFIKRLRKKIYPLKIRFYMCGEYGDVNWRPHYHMALFGYPCCEYTKPVIIGKKQCPCRNCQLIEKTWGKGFTYLGDLTKDSAQYIGGYITKKMSYKTDPRLLGRKPEFSRMSNRPGIGAQAMDSVKDVLETKFGVLALQKENDVPQSLSHGKKSLPLGRYLRSKLREKLGWEETGTPTDKLSELQKENIEFYFQEKQKEENKRLGMKELLQKVNKQKILNVESKFKIYANKERKL